MRIDQIISERKPVFSFEFYPPKTDEGVTNLYETVAKLRELDPAFVSVTYGAGGSTRDRTLAIVSRIKNELEIEAMAHFTCVGATTEELREVLDEIAATGVENVIALRGDPPVGQETFVKTEGGLGHGDELTALITENYDFCVAAACYPEVHPESESAESDLEAAKKKVEAGASFLVTQLFFDNDSYFDFVDRARAAGIDVPIIPGIMPIGGYEQIKRFTSLCGAKIPERLMRELDARKDDPEAVADLGVAYATLQCADLLARGVPGIHFYTLNKSPATRAILSSLLAARPWDRSLAAGEAAAAS
ncbi:MAG TPA: methylenetetrahydrofolate reductase [NAD(P)H] [Solirubrobacterales bacterium]|jgi:methylenetetrahydrofolate reductase (NADPH)|nr:methylenetetrahydrofolate reductase [NAD(P)H] [Solirubrobacterales bacterium]